LDSQETADGEAESGGVEDVTGFGFKKMFADYGGDYGSEGEAARLSEKGDDDSGDDAGDGKKQLGFFEFEEGNFQNQGERDSRDKVQAGREHAGF